MPRVAADGVVDDIGAFAAGQRAHAVANTFLPVVDQFVSPARTRHGQLFRAAGHGDDPSADRLADLDRRQPDPPHGAPGADGSDQPATFIFGGGYPCRVRTSSLDP